MNIVIFGATGGVGRHLVTQALEAGHTVTVVIRQSSAFSIQHPQLRVQVGNVLDRACVEAAVAGQDAVLSALGPNQRGPVSLCTNAVGQMLAAMEQHSVRRILVVSAYGAADSHHRNLYNLALWLSVKEKMIDKECMEALLQQSDVEWTVVRPPALTKGLRTQHYHTGTDLHMHITSKISHADVADFMVRQIASRQYVRQAPAIVAQRSRVCVTRFAS